MIRVSEDLEGEEGENLERGEGIERGGSGGGVPEDYRVFLDFERR